jgi:5-hydroxyisourate hydrolase
MSLSTHVLDTARGIPAAGIAITLYAVDGDRRTRVAYATTNADGRTDAPLATDLTAGMYEIVFDVADYFARASTPTFYTTVPVRFTIAAEARHYHVPLLLSPWGYSTYRGS